nr:unnamed protein product [Leishmania braziliensis]
MFDALPSNTAPEAADAASVERAALAYERVRRDNELQRYLQTRKAYEVACIARGRCLLVLQSHNQTLRLLQQVIGDVKTALEATLKKRLLVRESTVTAAETLVASCCYKKAEQGLVALLTREKRHNELLQVVDSPTRPPATGTPPIPQMFSTVSRADEPVAPSSQRFMMRPLLTLAELQLHYTPLLLHQRLPLFSELARAQRLVYGYRGSPRVAHALAAAPTSVLQQCRVQVLQARASLASARATQQSLKERLYHLQQVLRRSRPVHAGSGVYLDDGVAEEIQAQLRRELAVGCVTLLRILCENGSDAFDERGRLRTA